MPSNQAQRATRSEEHAKEALATQFERADLKSQGKKGKLLLSLIGPDDDSTTMRTNESMNGDLSPQKLFELDQCGILMTVNTAETSGGQAQFATFAARAMNTREPKSELLNKINKLNGSRGARGLEHESDENEIRS
jgi:hypothetical protein